MISIEEALERILSYVDVLEVEEAPLLRALGQVLAEDVRSPFDIPPLDNTAMDGYAVRAEDTRGASPVRPVELEVVGEVAAGYVFPGQVLPGTAVRIMTGAPIPAGADAVVPFEDTDEPFQAPPEGARRLRRRQRVRIFRQAAPGDNIRRAGEDIARGQRVLRAGSVLRPADIAVLAALGRATVRVVRRPVVAIVSTGDELVPVGRPKPENKIYDSNAHGLAALVLRYGGVPRLLGIARDTVPALRAKLDRALEADMVVTSAGVSRGYYDVVKEVLAREGEVDFWTVAMKPGKPLAFGCFYRGERRVPHLGLPGNPVSALLAFELFGRPAIFKMMGKRDWSRPRITAIAEERIDTRTDDRVFFARCVVTRRHGRYYARLTGPQGSGILTSMVYANAVTAIPPQKRVVEPGEEIEVIMLDWSHGEEWGTEPGFLAREPRFP